jgi:hypothetical protein
MHPVASTHPSSASSPRDIRDDATCITYRRVSTSFEANWETLARLIFTRSKTLYLDVCPVPTSSHRFCGATHKLLSAWFWGSNKKTVAVIFRLKSPNRSYQFWGQNQETVDLGIEAKPRNPCSSSPCARSRPNTALLNLLIIRPLSTRPVLDHLRSFVPGLLLLPRSSSLPAMSHLSPTHHETSKHDSPHEPR